jgi:hypothetical protein
MAENGSLMAVTQALRWSIGGSPRTLSFCEEFAVIVPMRRAARQTGRGVYRPGRPVRHLDQAPAVIPSPGSEVLWKTAEKRFGIRWGPAEGNHVAASSITAYGQACYRWNQPRLSAISAISTARISQFEIDQRVSRDWYKPRRRTCSCKLSWEADFSKENAHNLELMAGNSVWLFGEEKRCVGCQWLRTWAEERRKAASGGHVEN